MGCLDTTVFLDLAGRGGRALCERAKAVLLDLSQHGDPLTTTRLNLAELYVGAARSARPHHELARIQGWLADVTILDFDDTAARVFGEVVGELLARGAPIGDMDALIAAVAIRHNQTVITRNVRHFRGVPGLRVMGY